MKDELVKKLELEVNSKLDDECWKGLQELYTEIDYLQRRNKELEEINEAHHKINAELRKKLSENQIEEWYHVERRKNLKDWE